MQVRRFAIVLSGLLIATLVAADGA